MKKIMTSVLLLSTISVLGKPGKHFNYVEEEMKRVAVEIPMDEFRVLKNVTRPIPLKVKVQKLRPDLKLGKADLRRVILMAKSRKGLADATIIEGSIHSRSQAIPASPKYKGFRKEGGFSKVVIRSPQELRGQNVRWRLKLDGTAVKIKTMTVVFDIPMPKAKLKTAQCGVKLQTPWGGHWGKFEITKKAKTKRIAKKKACVEAHQLCTQKKSAITAIVAEVGESLSCVMM